MKIQIYIKVIRYLTFYTKRVFIELRQEFIKALIVCYFDLKYFIQIKIYALGYAISEILSYLILNSLLSNYIIFDAILKIRIGYKNILLEYDNRM